MVYDWVVQECEDGGTEGSVPGLEIAGLQDHFCVGICGDEFGGELDVGVFCYGLVKEKTSRPASLGKGVVILKVLDLTLSLLRVHPSLPG